MMVPLRVLGDRVLIKPDINANAPETLDSGVIVAKSLASAVIGSDPVPVPHRGTVIAVGNPKHPRQAYIEQVASIIHDIGAWNAATNESVSIPQLLRDLVRREPCCAVGDDVLFASDVGQEITLDSETYILLHEDDLLAIVEPDEGFAMAITETMMADTPAVPHCLQAKELIHG